MQIRGLWLGLLYVALCSSFFFVSVCLTDSVLAFHKHGMQGRSFLNNEVVQEISDTTRIFRVLGSDSAKYFGFTAADPTCEQAERIVVLESRATEEPCGRSNIYILAGHENSY